MESHVSGGITPSCLGALRCEVLAVLIGNPLFTREEQLRANHYVHECEFSHRLALWLRNVRHEAERREQKIEALRRVTERRERYEVAMPTDEIPRLALCPALTAAEKQGAVMALPHLSKGEALSMVGRLYVKALRRNGKLNEN
jgi:hypothetical protein